MRIWKRSTRRLLACSGTLLLIGGLTLATASPANAETCSQQPAWSDKDLYGYGYGFFDETELHSGIEGVCPAVGWAGAGTKMWYHCYVYNYYGTTWTNVRIDGTDINGWVYDGNSETSG